MFFAFSVLKFTFSTFKKRLHYNERANCVNVIFIKVLFMEFIKSEHVIQVGNSSVEIRWVIQDGKVLRYFSSRSYHWLYMAQFPGEIITFFFQVNFSLHSFVISYEHRLQPGLNFIQDETFWGVCNFTLLKSVFEFAFMSECWEHFFVSSHIYSFLASLGPQLCRKRVVLNGYSILLS